jgi:hypothetical protein
VLINKPTNQKKKNKAKKIIKLRHRLGLMVQICNPVSWEAETGGTGIQGLPGLHCETLFPNKHINNENNKNSKIK